MAASAAGSDRGALAITAMAEAPRNPIGRRARVTTHAIRRGLLNWPRVVDARIVDAPHAALVEAVNVDEFVAGAHVARRETCFATCTVCAEVSS